MTGWTQRISRPSAQLSNSRKASTAERRPLLSRKTCKMPASRRVSRNNGSRVRGLQAATISGTIEAGTAGQGAVEVKSISGSVSLQVPEGRNPRAKFRTLSGRVRCDCPQGEDFELKVTTLSGSIEITKA